MMGHKHLHELLSEDQEPFQLKNYIADRRCQLKRTAAGGNTGLQLKKRKPIIESRSSAKTTRNLCINHVCLFSFQESPDVRKSPFLDFTSPVSKSPCHTKSPTNGTVFLHIPARTAAMLLDAAMRIQKQSNSSSKSKPDSKNIGFGLLGSFLKRLKDRSSHTKRREISSVKSATLTLACEKPPTTRKSRKNKEAANAPAKRFSCSCENSRLSSADWSEKSSDLETSCSSMSIHDFEEIGFVGLENGVNDVFGSCEKCFCSSPPSPFRFSLQKSPPGDRRTPDFLSPATSPSRHFEQEKENYEAGRSTAEGIHVEEEEEKEQCSPVSVLDPPFDDDDDDEGEHEGGVEEGDGYDLECSYASVQRAKHQLLQKLRRFERLAELDPIELEKHMLEQCDNEEDNEEYDLVQDGEEEEEEKTTNEDFLREIFSYLGVRKIPLHMKRLISDLVAEENKNQEEEREVVVKRVCRRLDSWKMVESNTIDMMIELDFRKEKTVGWKRYDEDTIRDTGMDIEVAIFGFLVEELAQELLTSSGH